MIRLGLLSAASAIMLSLAGPSTAAQIEWTFTDAAFTGGGTLTGSFVWDTDTSQVQSYDFLTTAGSLVGAADRGRSISDRSFSWLLRRLNRAAFSLSNVSQPGRSFSITGKGNRGTNDGGPSAGSTA